MERIGANIGIDQHKSRCHCKRLLVANERNVGKIRTNTCIKADPRLSIFLDERVLQFNTTTVDQNSCTLTASPTPLARVTQSKAVAREHAGVFYLNPPPCA